MTALSLPGPGFHDCLAHPNRGRSVVAGSGRSTVGDILFAAKGVNTGRYTGVNLALLVVEYTGNGLVEDGVRHFQTPFAFCLDALGLVLVELLELSQFLVVDGRSCSEEVEEAFVGDGCLVNDVLLFSKFELADRRGGVAALRRPGFLEVVQHGLCGEAVYFCPSPAWSVAGGG